MASKNIKGITVEIGGDTTKLDKALAGVEKTSRSAKQELKEIDKAIAKNPDNIDLWKQKQEVLNKSLEASKDKLKTLTDVQGQMNEKLKSGEISGEQYRAFQRELENTRAEVQELQKAAESCSPALETMAAKGEKLKSTGDAISGVGEKMLGVTAAVTAVAGASVAAFKELDAGYDTIITKTGASGEALDSLKESMDNVFGALPTTAEEAGTAIGEVNTRFGLMGEELETLSEEFIKFANINGTDLNSSIDNVDSILKKFNMDSSEASDVLGLLTKVGQDTGLSMDSLESTLMSNGTTMKEMGLDLTESVSLLAQFEKNGVEASTALAGLKKAQQNATKEGKTLEDALNEQIRTIRIANDDTYALQKAEELFGKKGAAEMTQAIREGKFSLQDLSSELSSYSEVVSSTFEETQDPIDESAVAINNLKLAGAELGTSILTALQPVIVKIVEKVKELTAKFRGLSDEQKNQILKIGAVVAAIGPVLIAIGKVISLVGTLMTWLPKIKGAMVALNGVMAANPIGLIIVAIGALVAAFIYLWNNCEEFKQYWLDMWEEVKPVVEEFVEQLKLLFGDIKQFFEDHKEEFKLVWEVIKVILDEIMQFFKRSFERMMENFSSFIKFIRNVFAGDWKAAWQNIVDIFKNIFEEILEFAKPPLNGIIRLVNGVISGINTMIGKVNTLGFTVPDWVPEIGGTEFGFNIPEVPSIPYLAKGGVVSNGGSAIVGEAGAEFLHVANGRAVVTPLTRSGAAESGLSSSSNSVSINNTINATISSDYDVDRLCERLAVKQRSSYYSVGSVGGW